jgi:hypothetical protein
MDIELWSGLTDPEDERNYFNKRERETGLKWPKLIETKQGPIHRRMEKAMNKREIAIERMIKWLFIIPAVVGIIIVIGIMAGMIT